MKNKVDPSMDAAAWQRCCDDPDPVVSGLKWGYVQWLLKD
jgi:hypothetical protein